MKTLLEDIMIISGVSSLSNSYTMNSVANNTTNNNTDSVKDTDLASKLEDDEKEIDYAHEDVEDVDPDNFHNPQPQKILSPADTDQIDILL